jgi:hypothetical protein
VLRRSHIAWALLAACSGAPDEPVGERRAPEPAAASGEGSAPDAVDPGPAPTEEPAAHPGGALAEAPPPELAPDHPVPELEPPQDANLDPEALERARVESLTEAQRRAENARAARKAYEQR